MLEIVWNERSRVFRCCNLFREAAETVDDTENARLMKKAETDGIEPNFAQ